MAGSSERRNTMVLKGAGTWSGGFNGYGKGTASTSTVTARKSVDEITSEVIAGKWSNGSDRKNRLNRCRIRLQRRAGEG